MGMVLPDPFIRRPGPGTGRGKRRHAQHHLALISSKSCSTLLIQSVGTFLGWRLLDPIGGMVLSAYIIIEWIKTLLENFEKRTYR